MTRSRKAHIAGIGETRYARWGKIGDVTEHALALEAITRAVADASPSTSSTVSDACATPFDRVAALARRRRARSSTASVL